jgi:hypothetical protein
VGDECPSDHTKERNHVDNTFLEKQSQREVRGQWNHDGGQIETYFLL